MSDYLAFVPNFQKPKYVGQASSLEDAIQQVAEQAGIDRSKLHAEQESDSRGLLQSWDVYKYDDRIHTDDEEPFRGEAGHIRQAIPGERGYGGYGAQSAEEGDEDEDDEDDEDGEEGEGEDEDEDEDEEEDEDEDEEEDEEDENEGGGEA